MTAASNASEIAAVLKSRLGRVVVIVGIGNLLRSDDGAGPRFITMLTERFSRGIEPNRCVHLINCGEAPENYIGQIARLRPQTVIIVDTADLGLPPGRMRIVEADELVQQNPSTHAISPVLFMRQLKDGTGADVFMLGVQPAVTGFGEGLSPRVEFALTGLADLIEHALRRQ